MEKKDELDKFNGPKPYQRSSSLDLQTGIYSRVAHTGNPDTHEEQLLICISVHTYVCTYEVIDIHSWTTYLNHQAGPQPMLLYQLLFQMGGLALSHLRYLQLSILSFDLLPMKDLIHQVQTYAPLVQYLPTHPASQLICSET